MNCGPMRVPETISGSLKGQNYFCNYDYDVVCVFHWIRICIDVEKQWFIKLLLLLTNQGSGTK